MIIKTKIEQQIKGHEDLQKLFTALSEGLPDRHFIINENGDILGRFGNTSSNDFYHTSDPAGTNISDLLKLNLAEQLQETLQNALASDFITTFEYSMNINDLREQSPRITGPKGTQWFELKVAPLHITIEEKRIVVCSVRNITERKKLEEELITLSLTDPLTTLYNRRFLMGELDKAFKRYIRYSTPMALLMQDIDHFKRFNDTYGHDIGDQVLVEFSNFLQTQLRDLDILGRIGGEEFLILFPESTAHEAHVVAERLLKGTRELCIRKNALMLSITVSAGLTEIADTDMAIDTALKRADNALYTSKESGRDQLTLLVP